MFQTNSEEIDYDYKDSNRFNLILKEMFKFQNVIIYILSFLISTITMRNGLSPFPIVMLAACVGNSIPIAGVFISLVLGVLITQNIKVFLEFLFTFVLYTLFVLILKNKVTIDDRNEAVKTGGKVFWALTIVMFFMEYKEGSFISRAFMSSVIGAIAYVYYKVFVNGITIIDNIEEKKVYSVEEIVATVVLIATAVMCFKNFNIFGINVSNIIIIAMIIFLGYKNGFMIGAVTGLSVGFSLCLLNEGGLLPILIYLIVGILSGLFRKTGKIGTSCLIIVIDIATMILLKEKYSNALLMREIIIASILLLAVPKNIRLEVEDLIGRNKLLENITSRLTQNEEEARLEESKKIIAEITENSSKVEIIPEDFIEDFLDNMQEIDDNIFYDEIMNEENGIVREIGLDIQEKHLLVENDVIEIFKNHNNFLYMQDKSIKDDLQELLKIINRTYKEFEIKKIRQEQKIEKEELKEKENEGNNKQVKVQEPDNISFDEFLEEMKSKDNIDTKVTKLKVQETITEKVVPKTQITETKIVKLEEVQDNKITKINNDSNMNSLELKLRDTLNEKQYNIDKVEITELDNDKRIVVIETNKINHNKNKDKSVISNIESIISKELNIKMAFQDDKIEDDIYEQVYGNDEKLILQVGVAKIKNSSGNADSDSNVEIKLKDGKNIVVISDSIGDKAKEEKTSEKVIEIVKKNTTEGFNKDSLNSILRDIPKEYNDNEYKTSLDLFVFDLYKEQVEIFKVNSTSSYMKQKKSIQKISNDNLKLKIINDIKIYSNSFEVKDNDILIISSDGLLGPDNVVDDDWMEVFLKNVSSNNVKKLADSILNEVVDNNFGIVKDDITVTVCKVSKKNK